MMRAVTLCAEMSVLRDLVLSKPPNHATLRERRTSAWCVWPRPPVTAHKTDLRQQKLRKELCRGAFFRC